MRFAYADPPYLGCAKYYPEHPEAEKWDDPAEHGALIARLERQYDGWAYSLSVPSLDELMSYKPLGVRVAAWVKPFAAFKANVRIAWTWEPVFFREGRISSKAGAPVGRDHLSEPITLKRGLVGAKPAAFNRWVLDLMGFIDEEDTLDDLFPGSKSMDSVLNQAPLRLDYEG